MKKLTRRQFAATVASGLSVLANSGSFAESLPQSPPSAAEQRYSLQNTFGLALAVDAKTGSYAVQYGGERWLGAGHVSVLENKQWYGSAAQPELAGRSRAGKLVLTGAKTGASADFLGSYQSVELAWEVPDSAAAFSTGFKLYSDAPCVVFFQKFPRGFKNYASGSWIVPSVVFPQFQAGFDERNDLYSWTSGGMFTHRFGYGNAASVGGTVDLLLLADPTYKTLILSPYANYLVATQQCAPAASRDETNPSKGAINCGIEGLVEDLPAGFEHEHILMAGQGIGETFRAWGAALLKRAGKQIPSKYAGDTLKYPVYWDD